MLAHSNGEYDGWKILLNAILTPGPEDSDIILIFLNFRFFGGKF